MALCMAMFVTVGCDLCPGNGKKLPPAKNAFAASSQTLSGLWYKWTSSLVPESVGEGGGRFDLRPTPSLHLLSISRILLDLVLQGLTWNKLVTYVPSERELCLSYECKSSFSCFLSMVYVCNLDNFACQPIWKTNTSQIAQD